MNTRVFLITAKTNLHVGNESGDEFTIIDKAIQRDPLTDLPCINSSSLKGAINEFCAHSLKMEPIKLQKIFGSDKTEQQKGAQKGEAIFFDAKLLYLPQQDDDSLYHYATTKNVMEMMKSRVQLFEKQFDFVSQNVLNGKKVEIISDKEFSDIASNDNLPIIARNCLENGESKNLWYEQVLPSETILYAIIREEGDDLAELDGKVIQIGANATIGYGYCKFELINK